MSQLREAAAEFLSHKRLAVVGVSRDKAQAANLIYRTLRDRDYQVVAVNPKAEEVEGDRCYGSLAAVPGPVDGAVLVTPPAAAAGLVSECAELGIPRVWMHRSFGPGSVSPEAVAQCEEKGIAVIAGACPMMFVEGADIGHRCMRWFLGVAGKRPDVRTPAPSEEARSP